MNGVLFPCISEIPVSSDQRFLLICFYSPEARVSHLTGNSRKRLQEELDKCVVVCPNCHTKIHKSILTLLRG